MDALKRNADLIVGGIVFVVGLWINGWGNPIGSGLLGIAAVVAVQKFYAPSRPGWPGTPFK